MNCLIVDDEPAARRVIKKYIGNCPGLRLTGECVNAIEALGFVRSQTVDLIFLDINMPGLSGIGFVKTLKDPPGIILTTAYSEYALESYELNVIDYLLKPFSFERFLKAVEKSRELVGRSGEEKLFITVKTDGKRYRVALKEILYAEGQGDYITLHTFNQKLTFHQTLKGMEAMFPEDQFARIHKSYLVSLRQIQFMEGNTVKMADGEVLPLGATYKDSFLQIFDPEA